MGPLHCTGHVGMFLFGVLSLTVTLLCIVEYITILSDITMATQTFACQSLNVELGPFVPNIGAWERSSWGRDLSVTSNL